jgi:hypothetical protein
MQSEAIFSVHRNRQDCSGGSELLGPYFPIFRNGYPRLLITNGGCEHKMLIVTSHDETCGQNVLVCGYSSINYQTSHAIIALHVPF